MSRAVLVAILIGLAMPAAGQDAEQDRAEPLRQAPMQPDASGDYLPDPTQEVPLDEAQLLAAFDGKTHRGTYNFKRLDIDTFAFEETTSSDGRTRHAHGSKVDLGTWRVRDNVICFTYEAWQDEQEHRACFNIFQRGNCYYHYSLRFRGLGVGGSFTARSVHAGETPDCEPGFV